MEKQQLTPCVVFVILFSILLGCSFQKSDVYKRQVFSSPDPIRTIKELKEM